mmetsp:Transcript_45055/g.119506  ORF Transcript_45055/g.119506 Transcript_45055/m.119506 type:complete len:239 (+) Transcript_45055:49-765(+)
MKCAPRLRIIHTRYSVSHKGQCGFRASLTHSNVTLHQRETPHTTHRHDNGKISEKLNVLTGNLHESGTISGSAPPTVKDLRSKLLRLDINFLRLRFAKQSRSKERASSENHATTDHGESPDPANFFNWDLTRTLFHVCILQRNEIAFGETELPLRQFCKTHGSTALDDVLRHRHRTAQHLSKKLLIDDRVGVLLHMKEVFANCAELGTVGTGHVHASVATASFLALERHPAISVGCAD